VGKWESCFWISSSPWPSRAGVAGMWKIATAISKGCGQRGETCAWFSSLSTARHFHGLFVFQAIFLCQMLSKSFRFAACIVIAAWVSPCAPAIRSSISGVTSSFRNPPIPVSGAGFPTASRTTYSSRLALGLEPNLLPAFQKCLGLPQAQLFSCFHADQQSPACLPSRSGSSCVGKGLKYR